MIKLNKKKENFYRREGYLKVTKLFSKKEIFLLKKYVSEIENFSPKKEKIYDVL